MTFPYYNIAVEYQPQGVLQHSLNLGRRMCHRLSHNMYIIGL